MGVAMAWSILFHGPDERLDQISVSLIRSKHPSLWKRACTVCPQLEGTNDAVKVLHHAYEERVDDINNALASYPNWWGAIEDVWMAYMADLFGDPVFENGPYKAYLTMLTLYIRDVETERFLVPLYAHKERLLEICAHEISHFFFYQRVQEGLADCAETIRTSHGIWLISEALVPLLFGTLRSQEILGQCSRLTYACSDDLLEQLRPTFDAWMQKRASLHTMVFEMLQIINQPSHKRGEQCST